MEKLPPKTNLQNYTMVPHLQGLLSYFINSEKQMSLLYSESIKNFFINGYIPESEEFNNPEKLKDMVDISMPANWLLARIWLDLVQLKTISEKTNVSLEQSFEFFLDYFEPKTAQTLINCGTIANKYFIKDLNDSNWTKEIEKIPTKEEREVFKKNYSIDTLLSSEIRILAWIYKELFNKDYKIKKYEHI